MMDSAAPAPENAAELWRLGAAALTQGYRERRFTPVDALEACLGRAEIWEPVLNAMVVTERSGAASAARESAARYASGMPLSPLDGVPVSVKDNMHVAGLATGWGSRLLRGFTPERDEIPVARLRAAGAVIIGKTTLSEFAMQGVTANAVTGVTRNPWNPLLTPGGSSGGAVAGVAAGYCPLALGTDGGGSTRRPASHCGLVGFKPSMGLVPRGGGLPEIFLGHEVVGAIARDVSDAVALTQVLAGRDVEACPPRQSRILFVPGFADHPVDPDIGRQVRDAAAQLAGLGHDVEESRPLDFAEAINRVWMRLASVGLAWMLEEPSTWPTLGFAPGERPDIGACGEAAQASYRDGAAARGTQLFEVLIAIEELRRELSGLFARFDALLLPATAALPWPAAETHPPLIDGRPVGPRGHAIFTGFANAAGLPAIALPWGDVGGLPTGIQLVAPAGHDAKLLALARQLEASRPGLVACARLWERDGPGTSRSDTETGRGVAKARPQS